MIDPKFAGQLATILREAATALAALMHTAEAEKIQLRHFLPDELEGCALMLVESHTMPDECAANGDGHKFGAHGPNGAEQCEWCGAPKRMSAEQESRAMLVARLENMQENGHIWLTIVAVLALMNDCDMLAQLGRPQQHPLYINGVRHD